MKILLATESIPFPPRNGRELPTARIFEQLAQYHQVDIVVISQNRKDYDERHFQVPSHIGETFFLEYQKLSPKKRAVNELSGKKPAFFFRQLDPVAVKTLFDNRQYDFIWVSPPGNMALMEVCQELGIHLAKHSILGLNDLKSSLYADEIHEIIYGGNYKKDYLTHWLRSHLIARVEKKYLKAFDLIHVQTPKEKQKTLELLDDPTFADRIIDSPNGVKQQLFNCTYQGIHNNAILFMTHLDGDRKNESQWFVKKVWPKIKKATDAELWLVGTPPSGKVSWIDKDQRIKVLGYVPDLLATFEAVRLSVVPIFHGTGLINRIQDALAAGIPLVATNHSASTFPQLSHLEHLLMAMTPSDFADQVIHLYENSALRMRLSQNGREFIKTQPTWIQTADTLRLKMEAILKLPVVSAT